MKGIRKNIFTDRYFEYRRLDLLANKNNLKIILKYLDLLRKIEDLLLQKKTIIRRIFIHILLRKYYRIGLKLSFEIYPLSCGPGLRLFHPGGIIINPKAKIGKHFTIRSFSVIGNKKTNDNSKVPQIGDNVDIGCNCSIIGNINIGSNVYIGAGSVVVTDIPSNCIAAGNPAKVIKYLNN